MCNKWQTVFRFSWHRKTVGSNQRASKYGGHGIPLLKCCKYGWLRSACETGRMFESVSWTKRWQRNESLVFLNVIEQCRPWVMAGSWSFRSQASPNPACPTHDTWVAPQCLWNRQAVRVSQLDKTLAAEWIIDVASWNMFEDRNAWDCIGMSVGSWVAVQSLRWSWSTDKDWFKEFSVKALVQWEFQDPKLEVLYHIRPYFGGISPYIGLI